MDRRLIPVVIGIVAVIAAAIVAVLVFVPPTTPDAAPASPPPAAEGTPAPESTTPPVASAGAYIDYNQSAVAQAEGRVLLFFHASWCPQCRSIEKDILEQGVPDGITIVKVDYDEYQNLRQQYGVTLQTTFVEVDADGSELQKYVAYDDPHLDAVVAAMI